MDYKKDIDISVGSENPKNLIVFKLFEKDNYLLFIYKKVERIVSAFYLISNLLPENEPVRWQFRNIGVGAISQLLSLTSNPLLKPEVLHRLTTDLVRLLSLLDVTYVAGLVSEMNFTLLKKELEQLLETLNVKDVLVAPQGSKKGSLNKEFFAVPLDQLGQGSLSHGADLASAYPAFPGSSFQKPEALAHTWSDVSHVTRKINKRQNKGHYTKDNSSGTSHGSLEGSQDYTTSTQRQASIVELLKSKSNLTIKDFTMVIKGCSDKTIQRELLRLVKLGVLKKDGERRWSRYSLATL